MADQTVQLDRGRAVPGMTVTVQSVDYTVSGALTIAVPDSVTDEQLQSDLGAMLASGSSTTTRVLFLAGATGLAADNTADKQILYTVPAGKQAVVTGVTIRNASAVLTAVEMGFGWDASATDVVAAAATDTLATAKVAANLPLADGIVVGGATGAGTTFGVKVTNAAPGGTTFDADVEGYLV
jgi:hypothetical protein